jgi:hypothetical protein
MIDLLYSTLIHVNNCLFQIFQKLKEIITDVPQVQSFVVDFEKGIDY